jgi:hypothetical protein
LSGNGTELNKFPPIVRIILEPESKQSLKEISLQCCPITFILLKVVYIYHGHQTRTMQSPQMRDKNAAALQTREWQVHPMRVDLPGLSTH